MLKKLSITLVSLLGFVYLSYFLLHQSGSQIAKVSNQKDKQVIRWKMANTWGKGMPVFEASAIRFAKNVENMTNGRLIIEVDPSNKHKAPFGVFDLVRTGQYQMGHTASYYWKGKDPVTPLFTTVPFGFNFLEQYAWFYFDNGLDLMQKTYSKHNLLSFPAGNTTVQMGGWFKKEINSLKDLDGIKMRIPGIGGDIIARVGVKPTTIAPGELYTSLQLGTIDALEWVSPAIDIKMGFQQIANHYYTGWHEPASELQFLINKDEFEKLPNDIQEIVKIAMRESAYNMTVHMFYANAIAWEKMKKDYPNVEIKSFPPEVFTELKKQTKIVLDELAAVSTESKAIVESQRNFFNTAREWSKMSEQAYYNNR